MVKNIKRNRKAPDSGTKFYATGLAGLQKKEIKFLESILEPVNKYFDCLLSKIPPHISCRYLGYKDEVSFKEIKKIILDLKKIYKDFLPLKCSLGGLFGSWERDPNYESKLLMIKVESPELNLLHKRILIKTKKFPVFSDVENINFNPHFTLGILKKEFTKKIPQEVSEFIKNAKINSFKVCLKKAYIHSEKGMDFEYIVV
ncbi:hypothetical protein JW698_01170 [Candidatus Wolfebacteria bacterium]|nr:hypothetical protein [Candidatus Wolfebacteria bacterium]